MARQYVTTFHLHEPWLDADHLALCDRFAKKDGTPDYRCREEVFTLPVAMVLECVSLDLCLVALRASLQMCHVGNKRYLLADAYLDSLYWNGTHDLYRRIAAVYLVARDYVIDHAHERDAFLERVNRERQERERSERENAWPVYTF